MLIAEIRRKLLDLEEIDAAEHVAAALSAASEDLLTADVFGAIKYLPREPFLREVLRAVAGSSPHVPRFATVLEELGSLASARFEFWPSYPTPESVPGATTEPAVESSGDEFLIFFEAKLASGFGKHQIERQLLIGLEHARGREFFLILVTAGFRPPRIRTATGKVPIRQYLSSIAERDDLPIRASLIVSRNADRVLWISWPAVLAALESAALLHARTRTASAEERRASADILTDLRALMRMRQLEPFAGFVRWLPRIYPARPVFVSSAASRSWGLAGFSLARAVAMRPIKPIRCPIFASRPPQLAISTPDFQATVRNRAIPAGARIFPDLRGPSVKTERACMHLSRLAGRWEPAPVSAGWLISEAGFRLDRIVRTLDFDGHHLLRLSRGTNPR